MRIEEDIKVDFSDVLLKPKRSAMFSRSEVMLDREMSFKYSSVKFTGIPIIAANMDTVGTMTMATALKKHGLATALHKYYTKEQLVEYFTNLDIIEMETGISNGAVFYSMGIRDDDYEKLRSVSRDIKLKYLCIDVANGYSEKFVDFLKKVRDEHKDSVIMAGNVATPEMTEQLILNGVDIAKIGIGPGSACTTRKITGVGYPQLSAVIETSDAAHGLGGQICSDGGCATPGDIAKAFAGNADWVMLGGMLAAHEECEGEIITKDNKQYMKFYGMSSRAANEKYNNGLSTYKAAEGRETLIPYKGPVDNTVQEILGGIRSCCTYIGAEKLKDMGKCATFIRVNRQLNTVYERFTE